MFPKLYSTNPDIYFLFESLQNYKNQSWRRELNTLTNINKHRNFTIQLPTDSYNVTKVNIPGLIKIEGATNVTIVNNTVINEQGTFHYRNLSDFRKKYENDSGATFDYTKIFIFKETNRPVLETIINIEENLRLTINQFEKLKINTLDIKNKTS